MISVSRLHAHRNNCQRLTQMRRLLINSLFFEGFINKTRVKVNLCRSVETCGTSKNYAGEGNRNGCFATIDVIRTLTHRVRSYLKSELIFAGKWVKAEEYIIFFTINYGYSQ